MLVTLPRVVSRVFVRGVVECGECLLMWPAWGEQIRVFAKVAKFAYRHMGPLGPADHLHHFICNHLLANATMPSNTWRTCAFNQPDRVRLEFAGATTAAQPNQPARVSDLHHTTAAVVQANSWQPSNLRRRRHDAGSHNDSC